VGALALTNFCEALLNTDVGPYSPYLYFSEALFDTDVGALALNYLLL